MRIQKYMIVILGGTLFVSAAGCQTTTAGNDGQLQSYSFASVEPQWIREGEPLEYEGSLWYPADDTETLLDTEVTVMMEYRGMQVFIEKVDVKPYDRLYTKFGKNRFRYYFMKEKDDSR